MGLRDITRGAVGGYVKVLRFPVDTTLRVLGRGRASEAGQAVDHVDATAREVAGSVLGDDELKEQGQRRHRAAEQRGRAAQLKAEAGAKRQEADCFCFEVCSLAFSRRCDARLEQLDREERALSEQEEATTASDEAQRLEKAAAETKERRKRS